MDPYIERPAIWADFHDRLITAISAALQPHLRPRYAALVQDRLYVVESRRPIYPDVAVVKGRSRKRPATSGTAVAELDRPAVFKLVKEELREPYVDIIEVAQGNRLITSIEVLSPSNKGRGTGRKMYLKKRREIRASHANLVEVDLLRAGRLTLRLSPDQLATLPAWHYLAGVLRHPDSQEVYAIPLQKKLPAIAIPLSKRDADVPLDLQAAFTRVWDEGPYPTLLNYDEPPPGEMSIDEIAWCKKQLIAAGYRTSK